MTSQRLPGKSLRHLVGRPLLDYVIARARGVEAADDLVVATSDDPTDDAIVHHCRSAGVAVFRGSLDNVAGRLLDCAESFGWGCFARINGDSPFVEPALVDEGLGRVRRGGLDFVTNLHPRSFPYGVALEVFATESFRRGVERMRRRDDFEHVGVFFYRHAGAFRFANLSMPGEVCTDVRLTVDDERDFERMTELIGRLGPSFVLRAGGLKETIAAYRKLHEVEEALV